MSKVFRVLYVTNNDNSLQLAEWLEQMKDVEVTIVRDRMSLELVKKIKPDILVSYNYAYIISEEILRYMRGKAINLHISMLPWNKGSDPNFWSFIDDTPKGVTIHQIDKGLDTGHILYQRECFFDIEEETFYSTYMKLQDIIQELFKENWNEISTFKYNLIPQNEDGSYHKHRQLVELKEKIPFEWTDKISDFKKKYNQCKMKK